MKWGAVMNNLKNNSGWLLVVVVLAIVGLSAYSILFNTSNTTIVRIESAVFEARVADSQAEHKQGLSGTQSLAKDSVLLMVFEQDDKWSIWMKDMNFPIDILWLDATKQVVDLKKNVQPNSYPAQFVPKQESRFVIELQAGSIDRSNIKIGSEANFELK